VEGGGAVGGHGGEGIEQGGEFLEVERYAIGEILRGGARRSDARRDRLADIAHPFVGERRKGGVAERGELRPRFKDGDRSDVAQRENAPRPIRGLAPAPRARRRPRGR